MVQTPGWIYGRHHMNKQLHSDTRAQKKNVLWDCFIFDLGAFEVLGARAKISETYQLSEIFGNSVVLILRRREEGIGWALHLQGSSRSISK